MARDYIISQKLVAVSYYISYRHIIIGTFIVSKYSFFNNIAYTDVYKLVWITKNYYVLQKIIIINKI